MNSVRKVTNASEVISASAIEDLVLPDETLSLVLR